MTTFKEKKLHISETFPSKKLTIILQNEQQQHMTCTDHLHWHDMSTDHLHWHGVYTVLFAF